MKAAKLLLLAALVAALAASSSAGLLDNFLPSIISEYYSHVPNKEGYRFMIDEPNGSKREEIGVVMNPGTADEQLVVMGTYSSVDDKTDIETITMYTADKNGYKTRFQIKNRKLSAKALKSGANG
ncbi:CG15515 [Drosophila busckii]|uniref:CG15515 n=1 Tax=Drosophila busckii TaxID=30019 RepID=A0A0M3QYQ2_DROBS|nr:uncharacterized protein LOC108604297 [Drosophila busckii]ALC48009.1 CG15515 [Drosophila busckii]